jgi:hypothetical protein
MEAVMKVLFPIALAAGWITMVAFTLTDFANFYAAVHANDMPVLHASETVMVVGKPSRKKRTVAECTQGATVNPGLHN